MVDQMRYEIFVIFALYYKLSPINVFSIYSFYQPNSQTRKKNKKYDYLPNDNVLVNQKDRHTHCTVTFSIAQFCFINKKKSFWIYFRNVILYLLTIFVDGFKNTKN